ncbi:MAG: hypothetical protein OEV41_01995 [Gammaproteobacteria bacterium]|nr:hypothetical protein [Gammaproteobacteria bacterium]
MLAGNRRRVARGIRHCAACLCLLLTVAGKARADASPDPGPADANAAATTILVPATVDIGNAVVGSITIDNGSIFDLDLPEEDKFFYRLANKAHITTRPGVISQQLLFSEGDTLTKTSLEESERILRSNRYLQDAEIETVPRDDGAVDVLVHTTDVWTLVPTLSLSRSGGQNSGGIGIKEMNLFGTGVDVEAKYKSDVDRDAMIFKFHDRQLGDSWYSLSAVYAENSDGHTRFLDLGKPFYSLDSTGAHGISVLDNDEVESLYSNGEVMSQFRHEAQTLETYRGWSKGLSDGWARRLLVGVAYDDHHFNQVTDDPVPGAPIPDDRMLVYPFVGFELIEDRFEKTKNLHQINRTEDQYLGTRIGARLGYASTAFGSDRNAWMFGATAQTGFGSSETRSLILSSALNARLEDDGLRNMTLDGAATYFRRKSDRRLFYASLSGLYGHNLDLDNQLLLGGDSGLRGYPLRYRDGDKAALLTIEQRYFTDWYPFRLFRVGGAVFFDMGKTWNSRYPAEQTDELLKDVGFGLRLGNRDA